MCYSNVAASLLTPARRSHTAHTNTKGMLCDPPSQNTNPAALASATFPSRPASFAEAPCSRNVPSRSSHGERDSARFGGDSDFDSLARRATEQLPASPTLQAMRQRVHEIVEIRSLEEKLEILATQRQLSAERCENFIQMIELSISGGGSGSSESSGVCNGDSGRGGAVDGSSEALPSPTAISRRHSLTGTSYNEVPDEDGGNDDDSDEPPQTPRRRFPRPRSLVLLTSGSSELRGSNEPGVRQSARSLLFTRVHFGSDQYLEKPSSSRALQLPPSPQRPPVPPHLPPPSPRFSRTRNHGYTRWPESHAHHSSHNRSPRDHPSHTDLSRSHSYCHVHEQASRDLSFYDVHPPTSRLHTSSTSTISRRPSATSLVPTSRATSPTSPMGHFFAEPLSASSTQSSGGAAVWSSILCGSGKCRSARYSCERARVVTSRSTSRMSLRRLGSWAGSSDDDDVFTASNNFWSPKCGFEWQRFMDLEARDRSDGQDIS